MLVSVRVSVEARTYVALESFARLARCLRPSGEPDVRAVIAMILEDAVADGGGGGVDMSSIRAALAGGAQAVVEGTES